MRAAVFVFLLAVIGAKAGCEWYQNCGACVADSGCGWCSNDPAGVGSGSIESTQGNDGKEFKNIRNDGTSGDVSSPRSPTQPENGVAPSWLVNVRGQYERIISTANSKATTNTYFDFEGTGYVASPYFGQTWGGTSRSHGLVGVHKTKFTQELKAAFTVTPYTKSTFTVASVQSDTQATLGGHSGWDETFANIEFQIGNIPLSGTISYPDTSKQDVYGSWPPNPTKFTTELKDGYTIQCSGASCGGTNVRVKHIHNDQHMHVDPRFTTSFDSKAFKIEIGPRGTGLISGTSGQTRLEGSDPCKVASNEACYENTRFLSELRIGDRMEINANRTGSIQTRTVAAIQDDAHLELTSPLSGNLKTDSKFKIKTFHSSPFTYARNATGGLSGTTGTNSRTIKGYNSSSFTKNLMAGYAIVAMVPGIGSKPATYEKRTVVSIEAEDSLTVDSPFSAAFGTLIDASPVTYYNYESCPSLTYENFDLRTENGHGVITSLGVNLVYDNVQYSKVETAELASPNLHTGKAGLFTRHLKVGYTIVMDGITRTITKIVDDKLLHVDRAFRENVEYRDYSYRYSVRKTGDFHLHWKPSTQKGSYHQMSNATDSNIYSRSMIADEVNGKVITKQNTYLTYPPVCYNTGRCVPKSSHSLVGVESASESVRVLSSALPHQAVVPNYVKLMGSGASAITGDDYMTNCKPTCTVMVFNSAGDSETRRVSRKVNSTYIQTTANFRLTVDAAGWSGRVRYVTGTGTVSTSAASRTITGASKETKTKFNSEFASGWTITIGCGGATCNKACSSSPDCAINGKPTGGVCTASVCTAETKNITSVKSDTQLETTAAFTQTYDKVDYTIGMIPGLGYVTNSQNSKIVDGNENTRFLEQLKVGYTITSMSQTRTITAITSNKLMTIDNAFAIPGITTPTSYKFSGKKGTGEVTVATGTPKIVEGTMDVTQTQFQNELALGYLFMLGLDYKVVTAISSNTQLDVDKAFTKVFTKDDYNYESCWLSLDVEGGVATSSRSDAMRSYTNKKVYVEDACEIKPGCCGFKVSSVVYPDRFAYYKIRPPHTNMNIRVVVKTTEDNVDLVVKKSAVPTTSSYDFKSVRESNPWALTVPQERITCPTWAGAGDKYSPDNCDFWYIGVRGDNRYPQKTGASEYDLYVYTEFDWPNFLCSDAKSTQGTDKCKWLGIMKNEDANMATNDDSQAVMRLTPNVAQTVGSMFYSNKVHLYDGFETTFQFRMTGFSVGCNSVLYPSGFCGGGDGFAFVIQRHDDKQIGCTGAALGYAKADAAKQGNDWARHRCTVVSADHDGALSPSPTPSAAPIALVAGTCDQTDDGSFTEECIQGSLCQVTGARNGGCGTGGTCRFESCTSAIGHVLAVEFDTWNNLKLHDPKQGVSRWWINATEFVGYNDNHVAIFSSNLAGGLESDHALNEHFAATPSIPNLADGKNHTVKIKYWPQLNDPGKESDGTYNRTNLKLRGMKHNTIVPVCGDCEDTTTPVKYPAPDHCYPCKIRNTRPGNFAVFIDDMKRPVLQTAISLRKQDSCHDMDRDRCVLDNAGNAYIGFTAATGGERAGGRNTAGAHAKYTTAQTGAAAENAAKMLGAAQNHEILNWKFCNQIGCVPI